MPTKIDRYKIFRGPEIEYFVVEGNKIIDTIKNVWKVVFSFTVCQILKSLDLTFIIEQFNLKAADRLVLEYMYNY